MLTQYISLIRRGLRLLSSRPVSGIATTLFSTNPDGSVRAARACFSLALGPRRVQQNNKDSKQVSARCPYCFRNLAGLTVRFEASYSFEGRLRGCEGKRFPCWKSLSN